MVSQLSQGQTDSDLFKAKNGDLDALGRLLQRNRAELSNSLASSLPQNLKTQVNPSDLIQSAFLLAIRGIQGFRGNTDAEFTAWVRQILENRLRQRYRFYSAAKRVGVPARNWDLDSMGTADTDGDEYRGVQQLGRALETLSDIHRKIILLKDIEGLGYDRISEVMKFTQTNCRTVYSRARAALAVAMEQEISGKSD